MNGWMEWNELGNGINRRRQFTTVRADLAAYRAGAAGLIYHTILTAGRPIKPQS